MILREGLGNDVNARGPQVPRLCLHSYVRVCSTELQLQTCTKFFNISKYGFYRKVVVLIMVLIPFNKITQSGSWQPKLWINKMTSIWILTGKAIDCLHSLYTGELLCGHKKKAYPTGLLFMPRGVTWVNFCWVCAAGISEHLPHYSLFCGQFPAPITDPIFVTFG